MAQGIPPGDVCFKVGRERRGRVDEGEMREERQKREMREERQKRERWRESGTTNLLY